MKQVIIDILTLLANKPGLSLHRVGIELSGSWSSPYTRTTAAEMARQGIISVDTSGKRGHSLTLTEKGILALQEATIEAPGVSA